MPALLDRPPGVDNPEPGPDRPPTPEAPLPKRSWFERYAWHLLVAGASVIVTAVALSPLLLGATSRSTLSNASAPPPSAAAPAAALPTSVTFTATEFKFTPSTTQVPVGQKISITLNNTGVVEHDLTIQDARFALTAKPGQQATAEFTFDKPGTYTFICSIAGHKEAGMKGALTVVDPAAAAAVAPAPAASTSMADMPGMNMGTTPDVRPLPANLQKLPAPQMAPPLNRTEPAYVKLDLTTEKATAQMADGVAYDYWTF